MHFQSIHLISLDNKTHSANNFQNLTIGSVKKSFHFLTFNKSTKESYVSSSNTENLAKDESRLVWLVVRHRGPAIACIKEREGTRRRECLSFLTSFLFILLMSAQIVILLNPSSNLTLIKYEGWTVDSREEEPDV